MFHKVGYAINWKWEFMKQGMSWGEEGGGGIGSSKGISVYAHDHKGITKLPKQAERQTAASPWALPMIPKWPLNSETNVSDISKGDEKQKIR